MTRRIRVRGIKREEVNTDDLAYVFYRLGKQRVEDKRRRAEAERTKRQRREVRP